MLMVVDFSNLIRVADFYSISESMFKVKLLSRHSVAVGTSGRHGQYHQYVANAIGLYRRRPCLRVVAMTAVGDMCAPTIRWTFPGEQRVRKTLLEIKEKTNSDWSGIQAKSQAVLWTTGFRIWKGPRLFGGLHQKS